MAREAYRSLYGDLTKLRDASLLDDSALTDDVLFPLLLAVSEAIDGFCSRHFYAVEATRTFDGVADVLLSVPDLVSVASLTADDDDDGTHETTWAAADYQLLPLNAAPTVHWGRAHHSIRALVRGAKQTFSRGPGRYQIAGTWGYRLFTEASGSLTAVSMSSSATSLNVDDGSDFAIGQTIVIDSEQVLITGITSNTLAVSRGLNGTTAASHADNTTVSIVRWPAPVERAALINAARIYSRGPAFEPFYVDVDLDTDVRAMLDPYRLMSVQG